MARSTAQRNAARKRKRMREREQRMQDAAKHSALVEHVKKEIHLRYWRIAPGYRERISEYWLLPDADGWTRLQGYHDRRDKLERQRQQWREAFYASGGWANVNGINHNLKHKALDWRSSQFAKHGSIPNAHRHLERETQPGEKRKLLTRQAAFSSVGHSLSDNVLRTGLDWGGIQTNAELSAIYSIIDYQWSV